MNTKGKILRAEFNLDLLGRRKGFDERFLTSVEPYFGVFKNIKEEALQAISRKYPAVIQTIVTNSHDESFYKNKLQSPFIYILKDMGYSRDIIDNASGINTEAYANGVLHGNDAGTLEKRKDRERLKALPKNLALEMRIRFVVTPNFVLSSFTDQGNGFDIDSLPEADPFATSGRGMFMAKWYLGRENLYTQKTKEGFTFTYFIQK